MPGISKKEQSETATAKNSPKTDSDDTPSVETTPDSPISSASTTTDKPAEYGGQKGPEPTRYGDWEKNGRCTDF